MTDFDLETYLTQWRAEQREDMGELRKDITNAVTTLNIHHSRLVLLEGLAGNVKKLTWGVVTAIIAAVVGLIKGNN